MSPSRARVEQCGYLARGTSASVRSVTAGVRAALVNLTVADGIAWFLSRWLFRCRHFFRCLGHFIDHAFEIVQAGDGNDHRVALGPRILCDAQKPAPRIFFERDGNQLALDLKLSGFDGVFLDKWPRWLGITIALIRTATVGRWTFV